MVLLIPSSASAGYAYDYVEHDPYFSQVFSGFRQCAKSRNLMSTHYSVWDMLASANTDTMRNTGCSTLFGLPTGWIGSKAAIEVLLGSTWYIAKSDYRVNDQVSSNAAASTNYALGAAPNSAFYRHTSGHEAAIAGGWKLDIIPGLPYWES